MKKKLLVLLIAVIPTLMPNLASAVAIEINSEVEEIILIQLPYIYSFNAIEINPHHFPADFNPEC